MTNIAFLNYVIDDCKKHNIKVLLTNTKYVIIKEDKYLKVDGYFDESGFIKIASNKSQQKWFPVLIHEYSHFLQHKQKSKIYKQYQNISTILSQWKTLDPELNLIPSLIKAFKCELECEQIAVKLIKKHNLLIDLDRYIKIANARLYTYLYEIETLKPYPYWPNEKQLFDMMPYTLIRSNSKLPQNVKIFLENYK